LLLALFAISFGFLRWEQKRGQGLPVVRASEVQKVSSARVENAKPDDAADPLGETLPLAKALSSMADAVEPAASASVEGPAPRGTTPRPTAKKTDARPAARKSFAARTPVKPAEKKAGAQSKNVDRDGASKKEKASKEKEKDHNKDSERVERYPIRNAYRYGSAFDGPMRFGPEMRSECRQRRR
jgi:hypothetical protein